MHVFLTGAAGMVGRFVARELAEQGHTVRALDRYPAGAEWRHKGIEWVFGDVADSLSMMTHVSGCDAVIHCAAYPRPENVSSAELLRVNVIGTSNVVEAAALLGVKRIVVTSSVGALGFSFPHHPCLPDYLPVDADHPRRPQDIYGLSKLANEETALAAHRRHGITAIIMRPPMVADIERMATHGWINRRLDWAPDTRDNSLWGYVDVRDLAIAMRLAIESDITGYHVFYPMADDVFARAKPADLIERHLPGLIDQTGNLKGDCFYDLGPIRELLGFTATRKWRDFVKD